MVRSVQNDSTSFRGALQYTLEHTVPWGWCRRASRRRTKRADKSYGKPFSWTDWRREEEGTSILCRFSPRLCSTKTAREQAENCKALVRKSWHFWSKLLRTCWELANRRHRLNLHLQEDRHVRHDRLTRKQRQILNSPMPSLRGNRVPEDAQFCRSLLQSSRAQMTKRALKNNLINSSHFSFKLSW